MSNNNNNNVFCAYSKLKNKNVFLAIITFEFRNTKLYFLDVFKVFISNISIENIINGGK